MTSWVYFRNLAGEVAENHLEMIQREHSQRANEAWWEMVTMVFEGMFH